MNKTELKEDAFGQALWAYWQNKESFIVIEREDGFMDCSGRFTLPLYFSEYKDWFSTEKKAISFVRGRVLDIGCGAGRHSLYLQNKGYEVIGIDNSPLAIKVCKRRGLKNSREMSIADIKKFKPNSFDTIIMMGNNFGLFNSFNKARQLLKVMHKITSSDAVIITASNDIYATNESAHLEYQKSNRKKGRMSGQMKLRIRFKQYIEKWFDYLIVSPKEMEEILGGTGWRVEKFIREKDEASYHAIVVKE